MKSEKLKLIPEVVVFDLEVYTDKRGSCSELFRNDLEPLRSKFGMAMGYMSFTFIGETRGPHEHLYQTDYFVFIGPGNFEFTVWKNNDGEIVKESILVGENRKVGIIVPPGIVHGYRNVGNVTGLTLNFPNKLYKGVDKKEEVDEIRWENDTNSPYHW